MYGFTSKFFHPFLAHLSQRLRGAYRMGRLRRPSSSSSVHNFKWLLLWNYWANCNQISYVASRGRGNEKLFKGCWSRDQDGSHAHMKIYGKNLKKSSFPESKDQWPWNLVCSIVYGSTTKVIQIMTLGWPWPILGQGQIWSHRLLYGKKWKLFIFWKPLQPWVSKLLEAFN